MKRWVYLTTNGAQLSVYAADEASAVRLLTGGAKGARLAGRPAERPLADEPVTLVDWSGR